MHNDYFLRIGGRRRCDYNPRVHGSYIDSYVSNEFWGVQTLWSAVDFHPSVSSEHIAILGDEEGNVGIVDVRRSAESSEYTVDDEDMLQPNWLVTNFDAHRACLMDLCFIPADPRKFITASGDEHVKVWDLETTTELYRLHGHNRSVVGLTCWKSDAHTFATGGRDGLICLWDIREPPSENVTAQRPTGSILDAHGITITHADVGLPSMTPKRNNKTTLQPPPLNSHITSLLYLDENLLVSGADMVESGLGVWDVRSGVSQQMSKPVRVCKFPDTALGRGKGVASLCVDRHRFGLYAASTDGSVHEFVLNDLKWRCDDSEPPRMYIRRTTIRRDRVVPSRREYTACKKNRFYATVAASPISDHILCSFADSEIRVWDTKETSQKISPSYVLPGHFGEVADVAWSVTGRYIVALDDLRPNLWDCRTEHTKTTANGTRRYTAQRIMRQTTLNFNEAPSPPRKVKKRYPFQRDADDQTFENNFTIVANSDGSYFERDRPPKPQHPFQRNNAAEPKSTNGFITARGEPIDTVDFDYRNTEVKPKKTQVKVNFPYPSLSTTCKAVKSQYRCPSLNMAIRQEMRSEQNDFDEEESDFLKESQESRTSAFTAVSSKTDQSSVTSQNDLKSDPALKHFEEHLIEMITSEIMVLNTDVSWEDVAGLEGAKKSLREIVVLPFKRPDLFTGIRAPAKGVLLFGPPGTGKTMIGRCVASQCNATFFNISASSLTSKWVGEGEKLVRALFAIARLKLPSVIFIDEIDSLLSCRKDNEHESSRRIKTEFLVQLDGIATNSEERLLILGATNRPQELDEAARRRFAKRLYIALPCFEARNMIVSSLIADQKHCISQDDLRNISSLTEGYSGADMRQLCAEAAMAPIRDVDNLPYIDFESVRAEDIRPISVQDFHNALRVVRPTVVEEDLVAYKDWDKKFGCLL